LSLFACMPTSQYAYSMIAVGGTQYNQQVANAGGQGYWFFVLDAATLKVVANVLQASGNQVPALAANPGDILIVTTLGVTFDNQPQGPLTTFLQQNGAGTALQAIEQLATQIGCGTLGGFGYSLVTTYGDSNPGFEAMNASSDSGAQCIQVLALDPVTQPNGGVIYTPVELGS
jgi:hypothetical protein